MAVASTSSQKASYTSVIEIAKFDPTTNDVENDEKAEGETYSIQKLGTVRRSPSIPVPSFGGNGSLVNHRRSSSSTNQSASSSDFDEVGVLGVTTRDSLSNLSNEAEVSMMYSSAIRFQSRKGDCEKLCPHPLTFGLLWQSRYFVLETDGALYYFASRDAAEQGLGSCGVILISDIQKDCDGSPKMKLKDKQLSIRVHSKQGRIYRFRFLTETEAREWDMAIRSHM